MSFFENIRHLIQRFADRRPVARQTKQSLESIQQKVMAIASPLQEHFSLDELAELLFDDEPVVRELAQMAIHEIIQNKTCMQLSKMSAIQPRYLSKWYKLKPDDIDAITTIDETKVSILGLLSMHHNGYIRHAAVRRLGIVQNGHELPFLLIRLNDWVANIRVDVEPLVKLRLREENIPFIVGNLDFLCHSMNFQRYRYASVVHLCIGLLLSAQNQSQLIQLARSVDILTRKSLYRIVFDTFAERSLPLIEYGLECSDPHIRLWSLRKAAKLKPASEMHAILEQLHGDRFMPLRRESYLIATELFPQQADILWKQALTDSSPSICEYAVFYLNKLGNFDTLRYLRELAARDPVSPGALISLGQAGEESDLPTIRHALATGRVKVRIAAIRSLAMIGKASVQHELVGHIADSSGAVAHEAKYQLIKLDKSIACEQLFRLIESAQYPHVVEIGFQLIQRQSKWDVLPWLIRLLGHEDMGIAGEAERAITAWFTPPLCNRSYIKPSDMEWNTMQQALAQFDMVKNPFLKQLSKWLDEFR